jgi:hypothetical protein
LVAPTSKEPEIDGKIEYVLGLVGAVLAAGGFVLRPEAPVEG